MASRKDIKVQGDQWISINAVIDPAEGVIPVGTGFEIQLKGTYPIVLWESDTQPLDSFEEGRVLTNLSQPYAITTVLAGSGEIWAKCLKDDSSSEINVQVI